MWVPFVTSRRSNCQDCVLQWSQQRSKWHNVVMMALEKLIISILAELVWHHTRPLMNHSKMSPFEDWQAIFEKKKLDEHSLPTWFQFATSLFPASSSMTERLHLRCVHPDWLVTKHWTSQHPEIGFAHFEYETSKVCFMWDTMKRYTHWTLH